MTAETVPDHEHVTVDEETYWGLMYLHENVRRKIQSGAVTDPGIIYWSRNAEELLEASRAWNEQDPGHHTTTPPATEATR